MGQYRTITGIGCSMAVNVVGNNDQLMISVTVICVGLTTVVITDRFNNRDGVAVASGTNCAKLQPTVTLEVSFKTTVSPLKPVIVTGISMSAKSIRVNDFFS